MEWNGGGSKTGWWLLGLALAIVVGSALLGLVGSLGFAVFLYYATRPAYRRLDDHFEHPDVTATVTLSLVGVPILVVVGYAAIVAAGELGQLLEAANVEGAEPLLGPYLNVPTTGDLSEVARALTGSGDAANGGGAPSGVGQFLGPAVAFLAQAFDVLVRAFVLVAVAFYLLRDDFKMGAWLRRSFDHDPTVVEFANAVDRDLETVFYGNLVTIGVTGVIAVVVYWLLNLLVPAGQGISRPFLLGTLTGVSVLVPVVGMKLVYVPYTLVLALRATGGDLPTWFPVVFFVVTLVVVDTIPDVFIRSYLAAGEDLNLGLVLLAYVIGTVAFGWAGVFVGPIVLVVGYQFATRVFPDLVTGRPVR
jgi:predicted PurR-regulated permease PerM